MRKLYKDLAIIKTNKPNSKKVMLDFIKEFGYQEYYKEDLKNKREIAITFVSSDIEFEIENYSRTYLKNQEKYGQDKFSLELVKIDRKGEKHTLRKMEFVKGEKILDEKNDTIEKLIEKEEEQFKNKSRKTNNYRNKNQKNFNNGKLNKNNSNNKNVNNSHNSNSNNKNQKKSNTRKIKKI